MRYLLTFNQYSHPCYIEANCDNVNKSKSSLYIHGAQKGHSEERGCQELAWTQRRDSLGKQAQFLQAHKNVSLSVAPWIRNTGDQLCRTESRQHPHKAPKPQEYAGRHPSLAWTWKILHCGPKQPVPVKWMVTSLWVWSRGSETDVQLFRFPPQWTLSVKMLFKTHSLAVVGVKHGLVQGKWSSPTDLRGPGF